MAAELDNARNITDGPPRPFTAIIGGAKVSDKIGLLNKLLDKADKILIGGAMAYTFIRALGGKTGNSMVEEDKVSLAEEIILNANMKGVKLLLPIDSVVAREFNNDAERKVSPSDEIEDGWMGLDIGPDAIAKFGFEIMKSKTIFWNGPMGVFEMPNFSRGTIEIARFIGDTTLKDAYSLVGGGDSVAAVNQAGLTQKVSYCSTGGGAMLELIEGKKLPGITALYQDPV